MVKSGKMAIEVDGETENNSLDQRKKTLKRKRGPSMSTPFLCNLTDDQRATQIEDLKKEIEGLFGYYKEMMDLKVGFGLGSDLTGNELNTVNERVALLMEESELPLSKLVERIYGKLAKESGGVTMAVVKSAVLIVGQRLTYGVPNVDADVLEDETQACLWCWETRDLKLMPKSVRCSLKIRRTCREKIRERITAVSAMITALRKSESAQNYTSDLTKASGRLVKVLREPDIRLLVDSMLQKNSTVMADKEAKREEKLLIKQLEKNKREAAKEKKRIDIELQKEKRQSEKELKRLQEEAEKAERRREKEESELRKQLRKQLEEAEKEQRRREKEEAQLKKRVAVQKQASIMERFLKRSKTDSPCQNDQASTKATIDLLSNEREKMPNTVTQSMDCALSSSDDVRIDDIRKSHLSSWHLLGHSICSNRKQHWSIRQKPKIELFKELKLTTTKELAHDDESNVEKFVNGWRVETSDDRSCLANLDYSPHVMKCYRRKQLLQFDKSHRPAFYGIWPKKSHVVGARHPFSKEPDLDYDVDSDEEWEEEDPGESLSDCDKDDEEESLEGGSKADDEEESEDGFFVPDGYLSENEGVQVDKMETDLSAEEVRNSHGCKQDLEGEEFSALLQRQKYLNSLTETALRKNHPLIILNLMHEKVPLLAAGDLSGASKLESMCLQALSMLTFPGGTRIEISVDNIRTEDQDACLSNGKAASAPISSMTDIQDSDIPTVVSAIQSCSQSITKVVESLHQKFPTVSKSQLRHKVREISHFVDNRWQVKKEILDGVGMSTSPEKHGGRMQNISSFFSKRCLPPAGSTSMKPGETSPEPSIKPGSVVEGLQVCTYSRP